MKVFRRKYLGTLGGLASVAAAGRGAIMESYRRLKDSTMDMEASDPNVVAMLTMMMNSPVILVPSLSDIPHSPLGDVYVFENGVKGDGPFGFQADVFSSTPGDRDYTPLRSVNLVRWREDVVAEVLKSVANIKDAEMRGELTISRTDIVVNCR